MQNMKNVIDDKFMEFVIPNIKTKQNDSIMKLLDLAKDKSDSLIEILSVAIFHHNIPIIKFVMENLNLEQINSIDMNALSLYNSILPNQSKEEIKDSKASYLDVQVPFIIMAGIGGHIDIFEQFMNKKLITNKKVTGAIGMSKKTKNVLYSNVIGACAYYGHNKLLEFILKNYKDEVDIEISTTEKKSKNTKIRLIKEYTGCTPPLLAVAGQASDEITLDILKTLKKYDAKFDIINYNEDNILHLAVSNNKFECAKYICKELGLKDLINRSNSKGFTPLFLAQDTKKENFSSYFFDINKSEEEDIEKNVQELLAESANKQATKGKRKKKKGKNKKEDDEGISGCLGSSEYQETLKEIPETKNEEDDNNIIYGLTFKSKKKNKKLGLDKPKKEITNIEPPKKEEEKITEKIETEKIEEEKKEEQKEIIKQNEEIKKEKNKIKKAKKEKRKDKADTDDFLEQMRKREKEKQEIRKIEEEKRRKEKEEQEKKEQEEQERIQKEEELRKEQEEKKRQEEEEKQKQEELRLKAEEEQHRIEEEEEEEDKSDNKAVFSYSGEDNNINNNISEENKEEENNLINYQDYNKLEKNYLDLEKRLSSLEKEKKELTSVLTKLYLENKSKTNVVPNPNEENINDLMYLANKELANKNEIINDLENKLNMLDLTQIKNFSKERLKKYKDFYTKNLEIINEASKKS